MKLPNGELLVESNRKSGPIGFIVGLRNIQYLYKNYILNEKLKFIPLYKVTQDHLELFFCACRSGLGHNNNPTDKQFQAIYKKLLVHCQLKDSGIGNCIPLEEISILKSTPKQVEKLINESSSRIRNLIVDIEVEDENNSLMDHDYSFNPNVITEYARQVVHYIAGFVVYFLNKRIYCEECLQLLEDENEINSLVRYKSRGGLKYPSAIVFKLCLESEKIIRSEMNCSEKLSVIHKYERMKLRVLQNFIVNNNNNFEHDSHHIYILLKSIIQKYIDIRLNYICSQHNKQNSIRNLYNKLILFKGM